MLQVVPHLDLRSAQQLARGDLTQGVQDLPVGGVDSLEADLQSVVAFVKKALHQPKRATMSRKLRHASEAAAPSSGRAPAHLLDLQEQDMQHAVVNAVLEELILDAEADDALRLEQEREAMAEVPVRMPLPVIVPDGSLKKKKKKGFCSIF